MYRAQAALFSALLLLASCAPSRKEIRAGGGRIAVEFDKQLHSRVVLTFGSDERPLGPFVATEYVTVAGKDIRDFRLTGFRAEEGRSVFTGEAPAVRKEVAVIQDPEFPWTLLYEVTYTNTGGSALTVDRWVSHNYSISPAPEKTAPAFWSYQSGSYESRPDWAVPLKPGFRQENYLGMNATDYGGGTPVVDVWRRDGGVGVGHVEPAPKLVSLPVAMPDATHATLGVEYKVNRTLQPGESLKTFHTFVTVHEGDYFRTLAEYRRLMTRQGIRMKRSPSDAFEPIWCAWGYGRNFTEKQVYGTFPIVKRLGFRWVTLDDGWQTAEGDWYVNRKKFPGGDADIRRMVDRIHAEGYKAQLWWAPMSVDPGTDLIRNHPDWLLLNADGSRRKITWWDAFYLCPALPAVWENAAKFTIRALMDWGFDGLKIDGQYLNGAPPCYNPAHRHARPEEAVDGVPGFFKTIYDTATNVKRDALVEICPCGTSYSFFTMPYLNMTVGSDPTSSWQVRTKGKTLKALLGDGVAYFGDHVELSDGGDDFASSVGVGGVVGTNFTWPVGAGRDPKVELTPAREKHWEKWLGIYRSRMLSKGEYLGDLYDIGFDRPEAHAIRKGPAMYYAFYAKSYRGPVELRGLDERPYRVTDYVNGRNLGRVRGPEATIEVQFNQHLMLEAK